MMGNNPKQDHAHHVNGDTQYSKCGQIMSICSQDIEQKQNSDVI